MGLSVLYFQQLLDTFFKVTVLCSNATLCLEDFRPDMPTEVVQFSL